MLVAGITPNLAIGKSEVSKNNNHKNVAFGSGAANIVDFVARENMESPKITRLVTAGLLGLKGKNDVVVFSETADAALKGLKAIFGKNAPEYFSRMIEKLTIASDEGFYGMAIAARKPTEKGKIGYDAINLESLPISVSRIDGSSTNGVAKWGNVTVSDGSVIRSGFNAIKAFDVDLACSVEKKAPNAPSLTTIDFTKFYPDLGKSIKTPREANRALVSMALEYVGLMSRIKGNVTASADESLAFINKLMSKK